MDGSTAATASQQRSAQLLEALEPYRRVVLASHVNPDPDALASMLGLQELIERERPGQRVIMTVDGIIARAENQAMVDVLNIDLMPYERVMCGEDTALVLVDTQPHMGRRCSEAVTPVAVLDHHETPGTLAGVVFLDVRPEMGATATLVTGYLIERALPVDARLATALYYGIESEIAGYPREASASDDAALEWLYPRADKDRLARIRNPRLPQSYFATFQHALSNAFLYDDVIVSYCGRVPQPDIVAELADFFVRFNQVSWSMCLGLFEDQMRLSVRADHMNARAGEVLRDVVNGMGVAGGHDKRAGGAIRVSDTNRDAVDELLRTLRRRFLKQIDGDEQTGRRLLDAAPVHAVP